MDDALWAELPPLLVVTKPRKQPGAPRTNDRPIFAGVIWLARTGSQWAALPREFGPQSTAHDRLTAWVEYGCLEHAWACLLRVYAAEIGLEWQGQSADGCLVNAPLGKKGGPAKPRRPGRTQLIAGYPPAGGVAVTGTC